MLFLLMNEHMQHDQEMELMDRNLLSGYENIYPGVQLCTKTVAGQ